MNTWWNSPNSVWQGKKIKLVRQCWPLSCKDKEKKMKDHGENKRKNGEIMTSENHFTNAILEIPVGNCM